MENKDLKHLINIPSKELEEAILKGVELGKENKKDNSKKNNKKRKHMLTVASVAVCVAVITGVAAPDIVRAIPGIGSIYDWFEGASKYKKYSKNMDLTVEDKGITVTLDELAMTDWKLVATMTVTGKEIDENTRIVGRARIEDDKSIEGISKCKVKKVDDNTKVVIVETQLMESASKENLKVKVGINDYFKGEEEITGNWQFDLNVDTEDIKVESTENKSANNEVNYNGKTYTVDNMKLSPLGNSFNISIKGTIDESKKSSTTKYIVKDDKGNNIIVESELGIISGEDDVYKETVNVLSNLENTEYIDIYPIDINGSGFDEKDGRIVNECVNADNGGELVKGPTGDTEEAWSYYNLNKEASFHNLSDLEGKSVKTNKESTMNVKSVKVNDGYVDITVQMDGITNNMNGTLVTLLDEENKEYQWEYDESGWSDAEAKEMKIRFKNIDTSKKYTIAFPRLVDLELKEENKIRVTLK